MSGVSTTTELEIMVNENSTADNQFEVPDSLPFDFVGRRHSIVRSTVLRLDKCIITHFTRAGWMGRVSIYHITIHLAFVQTNKGVLRLEVSEDVFRQLRVGDPLTVDFQQGRWTGALKGRIAR